MAEEARGEGDALVPGAFLAGRFRLVRRIGNGAFGRVWLAEDTGLENDRVACKVLDPALGGSREVLSDLKREVLLARRLRHPHILGLYTFIERGSEATNNNAEREIRPAVLMRKTSYGNRSSQGSRNQEILMTGVRTCAKRGINFVETVAEHLAFA